MELILDVRTGTPQEDVSKLISGVELRIRAEAECKVEGHIEQIHPKYGRMCSRCWLVIDA